MATPDIPDGLAKMARSQNLVNRIAATISAGEYSRDGSEAVALQLVGGVERENELGTDDRGAIHLALIADARLNSSQFASRVVELAGNTAHMNGASTSRAGAIGSTRGGSLTRGPVLDQDVDFVCIEGFDDLNSDSKKAFAQILDTGYFTFTQSGVDERVRAPGSVLLIGNPKHGRYDQYEPIGEQFDYPADVLYGVDLAVMCDVEVDSVEDEPLDPAKAREIIRLARRFSPEVTQGATEVADEFVEEISDIVAEDDQQDLPLHPNPHRLKKSLHRFAQAYAKYRFSSETTTVDMENAVSLVRRVLSDVGVNSEVGEFDADVVETGTTKTQRDRIQNVKQLISQIEEEDGEGAPLEEIHKRAGTIGLDPDKIDQEIQKLFRKGEAYEFREGYLRTT